MAHFYLITVAHFYLITDNILERYGFCIISGIPGIGKTTLAEMLLIRYIDEGYEAIPVYEGIAEAWEAYDSRKKQVFLYDDFLGRTGLVDLRKYEDERLLRFLVEIQQSKKARLILTTREYILNQAMHRYDVFGEPKFRILKCILDLKDYTRYIRARILYNHLYFSHLPEAYLAQFGDPSAYLAVINHKNYNPRIVERMTEFLDPQAVHPSLYVREFVANLDNPRRVWDTAFHHHLSSAARTLLLALLTLPNVVLLDDLREAFLKLYEFQGTKYNWHRSADDFRVAVKELEGTFVVSSAVGGSIVFSFHNPSIRDFLESHLKSSQHLMDLLQGAMFPDQAIYLSKLCSRVVGGRGLVVQVLQSLLSGFDVRGAQLIRVTGGGWTRNPLTKEQLFLKAIEIWAESREPAAAQAVTELTAKLKTHLVGGSCDRLTAVDILEAIVAGMVPYEPVGGELHQCLVATMLKDFEGSELTIDDFRGLADLADKFPDFLTEEQRGSILEAFEVFKEYELDAIEQADTPDAMLSWLDELEDLAARMGSSVASGADRIRRAATNMTRYDWDDDDRPGFPRFDRNDADMKEIHSIFQGLARGRNR